MGKTIINYSDFKGFRNENFRINEQYEVYYSKTGGYPDIEIGSIEILKSDFEEESDELVLFLPGHIYASHLTCRTAEDVCNILLEKNNKFLSFNKKRRK